MRSEKLLSVSQDDINRARRNFSTVVPSTFEFETEIFDEQEAIKKGKKIFGGYILTYSEGVIDEQEEVGNGIFANLIRYAGNKFFKENLQSFYFGVATTLDVLPPDLISEPLSYQDLKRVTSNLRQNIIKAEDGEIIGIDTSNYRSQLDDNYLSWLRTQQELFSTIIDLQAFNFGSDVTSMSYAFRQKERQLGEHSG